MPFTIPNAADAVTYPQQSRPDSRDFDILVAADGSTGVQSGCAVSAQGTPNLTVAVAAGVVQIAGRAVTVAAASTASFAAANATNPRIDLVTVDTTGALQLVTGVAAATPVIPLIPASRAVLARVDVPANATTITSGQIVDKRVFILPPDHINVKTFGAVGDGVTDDSAAIIAANGAMAANKVLYFPQGSYRFTSQTGSGNTGGGAGLFFNGLSNIGVYFEPGAELLMDNLNAGAGTTHGVVVYGSCSNVLLVNVRVRWATRANARGNGDAFRFLGYPSDSAPASGWTTTTGPVTNVQLINCTGINAAQVGCIFMGCSDVRVVNFRAENTWADGLHFNACRRVNVVGHTEYGSNDDGLAFVTYYHATTIWQSVTGPFNQPSLGQWSNYDSQASGILVSGGNADGVRVSGSYNVTVGNVQVEGKQAAGIMVDSALAGGAIVWSYQASQGVTISNVGVQGCVLGVHVITQNINSTTDPTFWTFGLNLNNVTIRDCTVWNVRTEGDGSQSAAVSGLRMNNMTIKSSVGNGAGFSALRDSSISNVWMETTNGADMVFLGQDAALTTAVNTLPVHNVSVDNVHSTGGRIYFQDINGLSIGRVRSNRSTIDGIQFIRCENVDVATLRVNLANRTNTTATTIRGVFFQKVINCTVASIIVTHDSNVTANWSALEIGGGDATDLAANNLQIDRISYVNTLNQAVSNITVQGGAYGPTNYFYRATWFNGGETTPIWRQSETGATPNLAKPFIGSGTPVANAVIAGAGSTYADTTGGGFWYKSTGTGSAGWIELENVALNVGQQAISGEYLTPKHTGRSTRALVVGDSGKLWFSRIEVTRDGGQAFNGAGVQNTVAQSGGTTVGRVGLYADDGSESRPTGAFLYDWGAVAVLTGTALADKLATIAQTVPAGVYWLAFGYYESAAPTTRATLTTFTGGFQVPYTSLTATVQGHSWYQTGYAGAALPNVVAGSLVRETNPPLVGLKAT